MWGALRISKHKVRAVVRRAVGSQVHTRGRRVLGTSVVGVRSGSSDGAEERVILKVRFDMVQSKTGCGKKETLTSSEPK